MSNKPKILLWNILDTSAYRKKSAYIALIYGSFNINKTENGIADFKISLPDYYHYWIVFAKNVLLTFKSCSTKIDHIDKHLKIPYDQNYIIYCNYFNCT